MRLHPKLLKVWRRRPRLCACLFAALLFALSKLVVLCTAGRASTPVNAARTFANFDQSLAPVAFARPMRVCFVTAHLAGLTQNSGAIWRRFNRAVFASLATHSSFF